MPVTSRPLEPFRSGPDGLILHITNSRGNTLQGIWSTFMVDNPFPSHFAVDRDGGIAQFLDTQHHDWAEENTTSYFSVENSANPGDRLSGAQINSVARIYGWLINTHHIALKMAV
jgi:N-acetyl-anhydromuramyl-L-alanine amidase AmpD